MQLSFIDSQSFADMVSSYEHAVTWISTCRENEDDPESLVEMDTLYGPDDFSDSAHAVVAGEVLAFCAKFWDVVAPLNSDGRISLARSLALMQIGCGASFDAAHVDGVNPALLDEMEEYSRNGTLNSDAEWYIGDDKKVYLFGHEWLRRCNHRVRLEYSNPDHARYLKDTEPAYSAGHAVYLAVKDGIHTNARLSIFAMVDHGLAGKIG